MKQQYILFFRKAVAFNRGLLVGGFDRVLEDLYTPTSGRNTLMSTAWSSPVKLQLSFADWYHVQHPNRGLAQSKAQTLGTIRFNVQLSYLFLNSSCLHEYGVLIFPNSFPFPSIFTFSNILTKNAFFTASESLLVRWSSLRNLIGDAMTWILNVRVRTSQFWRFDVLPYLVIHTGLNRMDGRLPDREITVDWWTKGN